MRALLRRTLLVGRDLTGARELLAALARAGEDTTGWEATTLRSLAAALARTTLADEGRVEGDDVALVEASGAALDACLADGRLARRQWHEHAARLGFRSALHDAVGLVRMAGVPPAVLRDAAQHATASLLATVLAAYEDELARRGLADPAHVFAVALRAFDIEAPMLFGGDTRLVLVAGLRPTGLGHELATRLLTFGAEREPVDGGGDAPLDLTSCAKSWTIRRAATPDDEVRAVLRDALARGVRWDDLELAVSDHDEYAVAARSICLRLGIPLTCTAGLPLARHRLGRAMSRWATFVRDSLDARTLWTALLEGDLTLPAGHEATSATRVAGALRALSVGWGRDRWDRARERLADGRWLTARLVPRYGDRAERIEATEAAACGAAMRALLDAVITPLPPLPSRGAFTDTTTSASALATAARAWLALAGASPHAADDAPVAARIDRGLARIEALDTAPRESRVALAVIEQALADMRWWPTWTLDGADPVRASRRAQPGAVHLVELRDAGITGRPHVALLGLDAERTGGGTAPEPFLGEGLRERVAARMGHEALPLAETRVRERRGRLDWALLRCAERAVTLSWSAFAPGRDAERTPAARVLEAARVRFDDAAMGHEQLRTRLGEPEGPVPRESVSAPVILDRREAWLHVMHGGAAWRDARPALHVAWPHLARAAVRREALVSEVPPDAFALEAMGHVPAFAAAGDPFVGRRVSASELEALGACPSRWFYAYLLRTRPPEDARYDAFAWLDARRQGTVLHEVFEHVGRAVITGSLSIDDAEAEALVRARLDEALARVAEELPPPSDWIRDTERTRLLRTLVRWVAMERAERRRAETAGIAAPVWIAVEEALDGATVQLGPYTVPVVGRIDRVDRLADGTLRLVDYKTGRTSTRYFGDEGAHFHGGRLVQPLLYRMAREAREAGTTVSRFEYRFPAASPPYGTRVVDAAALRDGHDRLLPTLVAQLAGGAFLPTDDESDCTWCDMQPVCRTSESEYGAESPRAAWGKRQAKHGLALFVPLLRRRAGESYEAT